VALCGIPDFGELAAILAGLSVLKGDHHAEVQSDPVNLVWGEYGRPTQNIWRAPLDLTPPSRTSPNDTELPIKTRSYYTIIFVTKEDDEGEFSNPGDTVSFFYIVLELSTTG
jgi:hypothetical protein